MMFINLSLLSPQKKSRLNHLVKFIFIKNLLEIVILICAILAISLLAGWMLLVNEYSNLAQGAASVNQEFSKYNQEARQINQLLRKINLTGQSYYQITPKIIEIANSLPADIKISKLSLSRKDNLLIISGTAKTRAALLNYQEIIKKITWLETSQAPLSQLLQKENVNFEIKGKLKDFPPLRTGATK